MTEGQQGESKNTGGEDNESEIHIRSCQWSNYSTDTDKTRDQRNFNITSARIVAVTPVMTPPI